MSIPDDHGTHDDDLPDSFDERQPDLPTKAVDPAPGPDDGQDTGFEPLQDDAGAR